MNDNRLAESLIAMTNAMENLTGRISAVELMQNAIATHLNQTDPMAGEAISSHFQAQYDALPGSIAGPMNKGLQDRLADFRQALGLPGNLRE